MNAVVSDSVTTIITAAISSITVLLSIWYREYLQRKNKQKNTISPSDRSMFYLEMDKVCSSIRISSRASASYIAYFHNGGVFSNGITMDKFTVVGEDYNDQMKIGYKKIYSGTMINYIAYAYHRLLMNNRYYACTGLPCGSECLKDKGLECKKGNDVVSDLSFRHDLIKRGAAAIRMFLIKDPVSDKPIGFFALEFGESFNFSSLDTSEIWKHETKLARLLNMTVLT